MKPIQGRKSVISAARHYTERGWSVLPIPYRSKTPIIDNWQQLRLAPTDIAAYFPQNRLNIGVLLGEPSHWLIDVDLDHPLARPIAEQLLPKTGSIFGRPGNPRSHWMYYGSCPTATRKWQLPNRKMIVELRSTGSQTVFPGSVHETNEPIEWDCDSTPTEVDPNVLTASLQQIYDEVCRRLNISSRPQRQHPELTSHAPLHVLDRARRYIAKMPPAISGQGGHNTTYHTTCELMLGFGLDRGDTLNLLREWNERCEPRWSDRELEHKVDEVLKLPGWRGYLLNGRQRPPVVTANSAIDRANRHAVEHRRRRQRSSHR